MTDDAYREFLARKAAVTPPSGLDDVPELHPSLLPHQRDGVTFAVRRGRAGWCALHRCLTFAEGGCVQNVPATFPRIEGKAERITVVKELRA